MENAEVLNPMIEQPAAGQKKKERPGLSRIVCIWLSIGVFMVFMQVVIGGITRLTGSGLSITKWEIVTGTLPPMNAAAWEHEFDLYKATPQYQKINEGMTMGEFKFIYFWEYFHRLWARSMGFVFAIPFFIFLFRGMLDRRITGQLLRVVGLAAIVASFGWIMVASGLIHRPWVNAYKLTIHLSLGITLFTYLLWITIEAWHRNGAWSDATTKQRLISLQNQFPSWKKSMLWIIGILSVQILLGGLMSGMKAAVFYPSFPKMGEEWLPSVVFQAQNWTAENFTNYDVTNFMPALVQLLHRSTAYVLTVLIIVFAYKVRIQPNLPRVIQTGSLLILLALAGQFLLGVLTLLYSKGTVPVGLGVMHQAGALVLFSVAWFLWYHLRRIPRLTS